MEKKCTYLYFKKLILYKPNYNDQFTFPYFLCFLFFLARDSFYDNSLVRPNLSFFTPSENNVI